jgi:hypothetical protein
MNSKNLLNGEYIRRDSYWASTWEIVADPAKFAVKFNFTVPGAHRLVTAEDIRQISQCGLIGRHGFFTREDLETVRGIILYEKMKGKKERV